MRLGVSVTWMMLATIVHKKTKGRASKTILTKRMRRELIIKRGKECNELYCVML